MLVAGGVLQTVPAEVVVPGLLATIETASIRVALRGYPNPAKSGLFPGGRRRRPGGRRAGRLEHRGVLNVRLGNAHAEARTAVGRAVVLILREGIVVRHRVGLVALLGELTALLRLSARLRGLPVLRDLRTRAGQAGRARLRLLLCREALEVVMCEAGPSIEARLLLGV